MGTTWLAGETTSSAYPPGAVAPRKRLSAHRSSSPSRQARHRPQCECGRTTTRVPSSIAVDIAGTLDDHAADVHARDGREREPRHGRSAGAQDQVEAVHRGGVNLDDHVARASRRVRRLDELEHVRPAVPVVGDRLHRPVTPAIHPALESPLWSSWDHNGD